MIKKSLMLMLLPFLRFEKPIVKAFRALVAYVALFAKSVNTAIWE